METKEEIMAKVGQELFKWLQGAGDLVTEQAPLLAQEIARYGVAKHLILALGFAAVTGLLYKLFKWTYHETEDAEEFAVIVAVCGMGTSIGAIVNLVDMSKALLAPRLYIIETIAELIKSTT